MLEKTWPWPGFFFAVPFPFLEALEIPWLVHQVLSLQRPLQEHSPWRRWRYPGSCFRVYLCSGLCKAKHHLRVGAWLRVLHCARHLPCYHDPCRAQALRKVGVALSAFGMLGTRTVALKMQRARQSSNGDWKKEEVPSPIMVVANAMPFWRRTPT